jgi:hypothetical protein
VRDPHVVALNYTLVTDPEAFEYKNPPAVDHETPAFRVRLADGRLRAEMIEHYATPEAAREIVDPFVRAWEIDAALRRGRRECRFEFDRPEMIDRNPEPGVAIAYLGSMTLRATGTVRWAKVIATTYPAPPDGFMASQDVQALMLHFEAVVAGRERLVDAAYFCLTVLQRRVGGGKHEAADEFVIHVDVLRKVGFLTSDQVGDERTARKLSQKSTLRPHTGSELAWLQAAVRMMIRRLGEHDYNPSATLPTITMADLPSL